MTLMTKSPITCGTINTRIATQARQHAKHMSFLPSCAHAKQLGERPSRHVHLLDVLRWKGVRTPGPKISLIMANGPINTAAEKLTRVSGSGR